MRTCRGWRLGIVTGIVLLLGEVAQVQADVIGLSVKVTDDSLYRVNLNTGVATRIGSEGAVRPPGVGDVQVEGLDFHPQTGMLYGWDDVSDRLMTINHVTGVGRFVGPSGFEPDASGINQLGRPPEGVGLTFDNVRNLFLADEGRQRLWSLDPNTGAATIRSVETGAEIAALAFQGGRLLGIDDRAGIAPGDPRFDVLVNVEPGQPGAIVRGGSQRIGTGLFPGLANPVDDPGLDAEATGPLWGLDQVGKIFTIDSTTGAGTFLPNTTDSGFKSIALIPEPSSMLLLGSGLAALGLLRRRLQR